MSKKENIVKPESIVGEKKTSEQLRSELADFVVTEVGAKVQDGITYVLMMNTESNNEKFAKLVKLRKDLTASGVEADKTFRCYDVMNGHIFDIDLEMARDIIWRLLKATTDVSKDLIGDMPIKRRQRDIERLARKCQELFKSGVESTEVALFSRNSVPRINITGKDAKTGEPRMVTYEAYAIRHKDIEAVNQLLFKQGTGIRISQVITHEILPSETGLRVTLKMGLIG